MNKELLKQSREWYLWHSIKNENALLPVIVISFFAFFMYNGWLISLCIWIWFAIYCKNNNEKLNNNQEILREREIRIKYHIENGDIEEYKQALGIY